MKSVNFPLSMMYGDHHVLAVRQLLCALPGVLDVYASSSFQIVEITYDEAEASPDTFQAVLAEAGYLEALSVPVEVGATPAGEEARPYFRHTAVFAQTGQAIGFAQKLPETTRPLWPCPGMER